MADDAKPTASTLQNARREHSLSQLLYFRALSLSEKMQAIEGMADVVRLLDAMRARDRRASVQPAEGTD